MLARTCQLIAYHLAMGSIDIGADVALSAVIYVNIQSLKLHLNFGSLFKCMTFVPDIPL